MHRYSGKAVITSAVAGSITLNPIVYASLTAFGIIVKIVASAKKYDQKIERAKFARSEYKKILDEIRFYLRGEPLDEKEFLNKLKMIDDFVTDHCMEIPTQINEKYHRLFIV